MARILIGNIKGPQGEQGPQGVQGPVGPQGPQGPLPPLVNNALATEAGVSALDAAMGKTLQDQITQNTQGITQLNSKLAAGTATCDSNGSATITFNPAFKTPPSVCAVPFGTSTYTIMAVKINEITADKCVITVISAQKGEEISVSPNAMVYWIAIGK